MKGEIFCGLASLFRDFKDRVQALCCICHHVANLHDRRFFSRYSGEGRHSQSEWRAPDMPDTRLPPSCGAGAPHSLHTCLRLPNKCLLCRLVLKIPRHIPLMQARLKLPLRRKAEQCVCAWVTVLTSSSLNLSSSIWSFRSSASFSRSLTKYEEQSLIPVLYAWTYAVRVFIKNSSRRRKV